METIKKSQLRQIIKEEIKKFMLKEENELIKTQGLCKDAIFKIKKDVDKLLEKFFDKDLLKEKITTKVAPWNDGYNLTFSKSLPRVFKDYSLEDTLYKNQNIRGFLDSYSIFIQPKTFFQDHIDAGEKAKIEAQVYILNKNDEKFIDFDIKNKNEIKTTIDKIYNINKKVIDTVSKELDKM